MADPVPARPPATVPSPPAIADPASPQGPAPPAPVRFLTRSGGASVVRLGLQKNYLADLYHFLMIVSWPRLIGLLVAFYLLANLGFGLLYLVGGDCIENARPGSFADSYFFSVQTMGTIGYGRWVPTTTWSHLVVTLEVIFGMLWVALATGLLFAKFSRPSARILFAERAVVSIRNGVPTLMLRMANERGNQIVDAQVRLIIARSEVTQEGERIRRFYDLPLARDRNAIFALSWTVMHPLDERSMLRGVPLETLREWGAEFLVTLIGLDETLSATVHARHSYTLDEVVWGERYVDLFARTDDGRAVIDYRNFHSTVPEPSRPAAPG